MSNVGIVLLSVVLMLVFIYAGMHISVALGLVSFVGVWMIRGDIGIASSIMAVAVKDSIASHIFGVIPLFVLMGFLVAHADIGKDAFEVANQAFRRIRGGLGVATVAANAAFAAITGISIASAAVFTRVAVPQMVRFGYQPRFAVGIVAGSSVLGMLLPPSLLMLLYAFLAGQSVGDMFAASIIPGLLMALAFAATIVVLAWLRPSTVFVRGTGHEQAGDGAETPLLGWGGLAMKLFPIVVLLAVVLGGIYGGLFTSTEAGAIGALAALLIAIARRKLTLAAFWKVLTETGHVTVSVSFLIICATVYTRMLAMSGMPQAVMEWLVSAGLGATAFLAIYVVVDIILGTVLDSGSIMLITLPLALPVALQFGMDPIWFGIVTVVAVEIGLLTPPLGLSVFVVKSSLAAHLPLTVDDIFTGARPFLLMMCLVLAVLCAFPSLSLVLVK